MNYLVEGKLTRGFAVIAYPAEYRASGVMTFMVDRHSQVYQKDLGPETAGIAGLLAASSPPDLDEFCYRSIGIMKVHINSDKQVGVDAKLSSFIEAELRRALGRFEKQLTRLEVHLSDLNSSSKRGLRDKRCLLEARPAGQKPVSVAFETESVEQSVRGAAGKMKRLLETSFGKSSGQTPRRPVRQAKRASSASASIEKLQQIQTVLSEIRAKTTAESPRLKRYMETASKAVNEARLLVESQDERIETPAPKRTAAPDKTAAIAEPSPAAGRSRKKKGIYQARRKAWPGR